MNPSPALSSDASANRLESDRFSYNDTIVRFFLYATLIWGVVACLVGGLAASYLAAPQWFDNLREDLQPYLAFVRTKPLYVQLALLGFISNGIFAGVYYSTQRLCQCRWRSDALAWMHWLVWQGILVAILAILPSGDSQPRWLWQSTWPIDLAFAFAWLVCFGLNFALTLASRRQCQMYVSLWFYIAFALGMGFIHLINCAFIPMEWNRTLRLSGVQDTLVQWWYGNQFINLLTIVPFVGLMYYLLPKVTERPLYSYQWCILHFWSLVFLLLGTGAAELQWTPVPEWTTSFAMLCGLLLWMPSWSLLFNGWATLADARSRIREDIALRFLVIGLLFYGWTTLESTVLSLKHLNALVRFSDWEVAHAHLSVMGWNGFVLFGMVYWLLPRIHQTKLASPSLANLHFWCALLGTLLVVVPSYVAGFIEIKMWHGLSDLGRVEYSFMESVQAVASWWGLRILGVGLYLLGLLAMGFNAIGTWRMQMSPWVTPTYATAASCTPFHATPAVSKLLGKPVLDFANQVDRFSQLEWHRTFERYAFKFSAVVCLAWILGTAIYFLPIFASPSTSQPLASVHPYTPLELMGREIYVKQGCQNCHTQVVRPMVAETQRYGSFTQPGETTYDTPAMWGNQRIGPDLAREGGGKQSSYWHWQHFENPPKMTPHSVMPEFTQVLATPLNLDDVQQLVQAAKDRGVPYELASRAESEKDTEETPTDRPWSAEARKQAEHMAAEIIGQGGPVAYRGRLIKDSAGMALIAYIQRLGVDLNRPAPESAPKETP